MAGRAPVSIPAYLRRRFFAHPVTNTTWHQGILRDIQEIPDGGIYDAVDFLVEKPGMMYKRGGWVRLSAVVAHPPIKWVGTLHTPVRVVAIDSNNDLYDVTSENAAQATLIGNVGFCPQQNMITDNNRLLLADPGAVISPKYVKYNPTPNTLQIFNLEGSPPAAAFVAVHTSGIVLACGPNDYTNDFLNRLWFEPTMEDVLDGFPNWDPTNSHIDVPEIITGLATIQGSLLVFGTHTVYRILHGDPPGVSPRHSNNGAGDMELQPFLAVGTPDSRSIVYADEGVIFAGEDGIFWTNGSGVQSLTDGHLQSYWRTLFPRQHYMDTDSIQLIGGMINRDFYVISVLDKNNAQIDCLMIHYPSGAWTRLSNFAFNSMAQGQNEGNISELYCGEQSGYVSKASPILLPTSANAYDGNGTAIQPSAITRNISMGVGMKSYGFGWLSYALRLSAGSVASWAPSHAYAGSSLIYVSYPRQSFGDQAIAIFRSSAGTSGSTQPNWSLAPNLNDTIIDGGVTWTNVGPSLTIRALRDIGMYNGTTNRTMVATGNDSSNFVNRKRFTINADTQALSLQIVQNGASGSTNIYEIEAEEEIYWPTADSLGR